MGKTDIFVEALDLSEARVDSDNRVLQDVVLIRAGMSANRRYYGENVLREAAVVFEGTKAYANHPSLSDRRNRPERSVRDLTGWYENVRFADGRLVADRHFVNTQAGQDVWAIAETIAAGKAPASLAGLSINAVGTGSKVEHETDGEYINVEAITGAVSVDDVSSPAAGGGYALVAGTDDLLASIMGTLTFDEWREACPEHVEQLKKEWQTVRQTEAIKAAEAEADRLREALTAAEAAHKQALEEAETVHKQALKKAAADVRKAENNNRVVVDENARLLAEAQGQVDNLTAALEETRRILELERLLGKVTLPHEWRESLYERLNAAAPEQWESIIDDELTKARTKTRSTARQPIAGAGQRVTKPVAASESAGGAALAPQDGEDIEQWKRRIGKR